MEHTPKPTGTPAPYGRACLNCARAKCRCIYRLDGDGCERCHRLKKDCRPSVPVRRRASANKRNSQTLSRTAQLEKKLDGLVELLAAQNKGNRRGSSASDSELVEAGPSTQPESGSGSGSGSTSATATGSRSGPVHRHGRSLSHSSTAPETVPEDGLPPMPLPSGAVSEAVFPSCHGHEGPLAASSHASTNSGCPSGNSYQPPTTTSAQGPGQVYTLPMHMPRTPESGSSSVPASKIANMCIEHDFATRLPGYDGKTPAGEAQDQHQDQEEALHMPSDLEPTGLEADISLSHFRNYMLPYFPFVHLPPTLTAATLRRRRPFLWLAIMAIACRSPTPGIQHARSTWLRRRLAREVVAECNKDIDYLLSLLAYMGWIHYSSKRERPSLSIMSQMAIALVYDLGLHKSSSLCKSLVARFVRYQYAQTPVEECPPDPATMEERRAALACYQLTSIFSIGLRRTDPMRWTTRMEEHLTELAAHPECTLDHVLIAQVRIQRIADQMHQNDWQVTDPAVEASTIISTSPSAPRKTTDDSRVLPTYVVRVLRAKADEVRAAVPKEVAGLNGVLGPYYTLETMLSASAVIPLQAPVPLPPDLPASPSAATASTNINFARVASLERCVEAIARFWSFFRNIPSREYASLPFAFFAYFTNCIMLLYGLSMVNEPSWDRAAVRDRLHVVELLNDFLEKLRQIPRVQYAHDTPNGDTFDVFQRASFMVSTVRDRWAAEMTKSDSTSNAEGSGANSQSTVPTSMAGPTTTPPTTAASTRSAPATSTPSAPITSTVMNASAMTVPAGGPTVPPTPSAVPSAAAAAQAAEVAVPTTRMDGTNFTPGSLGPVEGLGTMTADTAAWPTVDGTMNSTGDLPMDDTFMQLMPDTIFPDLLQAMGMSEDTMFWDSYLPPTDDNQGGM